MQWLILFVNLIGTGINQQTSPGTLLGGFIEMGRPTLKVGGTFQTQVREWEEVWKREAFSSLPAGCAGEFIYVVANLLLLLPFMLALVASLLTFQDGSNQWLSRSPICLPAPEWGCWDF